MNVSTIRNAVASTEDCAACKYQRRRCTSDCILAPYFPHDRQQQFQNARKLFGVLNIIKIIRTVGPPNEDIAVRTIIVQSDARAKDPVGGCYRIIQELQREIEYKQAELDLVNQSIAICRAHDAHRLQSQPFERDDWVRIEFETEKLTNLSIISDDGDNNNSI